MRSFATLNVESVLERIHSVVGPSSTDSPITLHEPDFRGTQAWTYVKDCLDTGWVSTAGSWVSRFEKELCNITGAKHAVVVSNGTVALRLALHVVGVGSNDEVLLPPLSFVATANSVAHLGAMSALSRLLDLTMDNLDSSGSSITSAMTSLDVSHLVSWRARGLSMSSQDLVKIYNQQ